MAHPHLNALACMLLISDAALAASSLGEVNVELRGNVVDFTCAVDAADSNKTVELGTWPTKQLRATGNITPPMPFTLRLTGCPPGSASITFSGAPATDSSLLALSDGEMAKKVAIELRDRDRNRLALHSASPKVTVDNNGNATLQFYANYIALADNPQPGHANADATFMINYY